MPNVGIKRIYEPAEPGDGSRLLVDRIWPRGVRREDAALGAWIPEVGPSHELRTWFGHQPERWAEFKARYEAELAINPAFAEPASRAANHPVLTLVYGARDTRHNQAVVLAAMLNRPRREGSSWAG